MTSEWDLYVRIGVPNPSAYSVRRRDRVKCRFLDEDGDDRLSRNHSVWLVIDVSHADGVMHLVPLRASDLTLGHLISQLRCMHAKTNHHFRFDHELGARFNEFAYAPPSRPESSSVQ